MADRDDGRPLLWFGLIGAIIVALIGALGDHGQSAFGLSNRLKTQVEEALGAAGLGFADVSMRGQRVVLSGFAPSAEAAEQARTVALGAAGAGGRWAGGVTSVDSEGLQVGGPVSPFTWRAIRRGESVTLSGYAPSSEARQALVQAARQAFRRGDVSDEMQLAAGAPEGDWLGVARDAVTQLAKLQRGEARLTDAQLVLIGDGAAAQVEEARAHYAQGLPQPFRARFEVTVTGEQLAIPELAGLDLTRGDATACQEAFARIMQRNVINFASGSAEIDVSSQVLLSNLASVALRCDESRILVSGHTDNIGSRDLNMELSQARAAAVVSYLATEGVRADRLSAVGHGPDRPRADNASRAGQAANRRIEFEVR